MQLPNAQQREKYTRLVKELEADLKNAANEGEDNDLALNEAQEKLDVLARAYQDDEKIGSARYKLYELQALIYYLNRQSEEALDFINQAVDVRGSAYPKATKLIEALGSTSAATKTDHIDASTMSKAEKRKRLIGLEGWLALFIVGQCLALLITIYRFFSDGFLSSTDVATLNEYQYGLGSSIQTLTAFENLAILLYVGLIVTTLVLLFRRKKLAKTLAIVSLTFVVIYGIIDYAVASSLFESSGLAQNSELQSLMGKYGGEVGKNLMSALIWVPYFLVSKRVKATLTKD